MLAILFIPFVRVVRFAHLVHCVFAFDLRRTSEDSESVLAESDAADRLASGLDGPHRAFHVAFTEGGRRTAHRSASVLCFGFVVLADEAPPPCRSCLSNSRSSRTRNTSVILVSSIAHWILIRR